MHLRGFVAEFFGVFMICFVAILVIQTTREADAALLGIILANGLTVAVMVSITFHVSGAQFNPAVSIGLALTGKQPWSVAAFYIAAQCLGGLAGSAAVLTLGHDIAVLDAGTSAPSDPDTPLHVVVLAEVFATFILMFVIYGVAVRGKNPKLAPVYIGTAVMVGMFACVTISGAAMNPARHLGPALIAGGDHFARIPIYWAGPIVGAAIASFIYDRLIGDNFDKEKTGDA